MSTVLIVEDEHVLRLTFEQFLLEEGYTVFTAASYDEAESVLEAETIDVVVSDIILGGKTGIALLRHISEREAETRVIMITGDPSVDTASDAVRLGAFDYLRKPVTEHDLKRVVRLAITEQLLEQEREQFSASLERHRCDLEAIFNGINAGIVMVDHDFYVRQVNGFAHELLGIKSEQDMTPPQCLMLPKAFSEVDIAIDDAIHHTRTTTGIRVEWIRLAGTSKVLDVSTTPIPDENSEHNRVVVVIRDITRLAWLEEQVQDEKGFMDVIGKSKKMQEIYQLISDLSETTSTVLIGGESGTGKEMVASALHVASSRADKPFIRVNCAALSDDILESELFGHVKGAFTGAISDRIGRFEAADGGSILLDEIGDVSARLQLRLLRVLQSGEFERVGDTRSRKVDMRVIAATNQDLMAKIHDGTFRQDLYYRLNVIRIQVPPLRDRREDIPLLIEFFCKRFNMTMKKEIIGVSPEAMDWIMRYPWPGNVRELENCIERAFIVCHDSYIREDHLPEELVHGAPSFAPPHIPSLPHYREIQIDRESILKVLEETDWNIAKTSRALGMARNTLYQKMKNFGIQRPTSR